jgi:hypothetical protein
MKILVKHNLSVILKNNIKRMQRENKKLFNKK